MVTCKEVVSTNIAKIIHDSINQTAYVKFKSGDCYRYSPVDENLFVRWLESASIGKFLNQFIKKQTNATKLDDNTFEVLWAAGTSSDSLSHASFRDAFNVNAPSLVFF